MNQYETIYLSPHLDDAALSCGGQIWQQVQAHHPVLVVTITAGDPPAAAFSAFAKKLHERWGLAQEAVAQRRAEDIEACLQVGADWVHYSLPDCIYRFHPTNHQPLYSSEAEIFGEVHPAEAPLVTQLADYFKQELPPAGRIIAPLGVGHHVDHQLVRLAAEHAFGSALWYYEDYPYAQRPGAVEKVVGAGWQPEVISLTPAAIQHKCEAVAMFRSQVSTFFRDYEDLVGQISSYSQQVGGERLWRKG
jgi:LmbE family N-acetylglucosaminyl deacetylase